MAITDYDTPRGAVGELAEDSLEELQARRAVAQSPLVDVDETEAVDAFELPGADLSNEELTMSVVPILADEFRCSRCFLVRHRSQRTIDRNDRDVCLECA